MTVRNFGFALVLFVIAGLVASAPTVAYGDMFITEWMYNGNEFVEFTNLGTEPIDMTGWSFDDSSQVPGTTDLSGFGMVQPGESVIFTELTAVDFRTAWSLNESVKVVGESTNNLGRGDEINLYDASQMLVDRLTYDDQNIGGIRTLDISGNPNPAIWQTTLGANNSLNWIFSEVGDVYGSYLSAESRIANPGIFTPPATAIPGDFNSDGNVDGIDFGLWQDHFPTASGAELMHGDGDDDGDVDGADFVIWQTNFPYPSTEVTAIPEPAAIMMMAIAAAAIAFVKRSRSVSVGSVR